MHMRFRLLTSVRLWFLITVFVLLSFQDEAEATLDLSTGSHVASSAPIFAISLLDVWAGISAFSDAFEAQSHVTVQEQAWIENAPGAIALLSAIYGVSRSCCDFYNYKWTGWQFEHDLVVTSGPSCCPFSVSGKRLRQHDARSSQGMDTASLAVQLGALVLIVENVVLFLDEDFRHHLVSEMDEYLSSHDRVRVCSWRLLHSALGGSSGRERIFLVWETVDMASCLPAWPQAPELRPTPRLLSCLSPSEETAHLQVGGQSELVKFEVADGDSDGLQATQVGELWIRGSTQQWMEGEAIKFPDDHRVWRIIQITKHKLRLIFDCRSNPVFRWVEITKVSFDYRHWIRWPVYSIFGVAKAVRHSAFAPGDLYLDDRGGAQTIRPLSGREKWEVQQLSNEKATKLTELGLQHELGPLAGNSIPSVMTEAVSEESSRRVAQYSSIRAKRDVGGFVMMRPSVCLQSVALFATFLVILDLDSQSVAVWDECCTPGMVHPVTQDAAYNLGCQWAEELGYTEAKSKCLLLEVPMGLSRARAIVYYTTGLEARNRASLVPIEDTLGTELGDLAVAALAQVQRMVGITTVNPTAAAGWQSGRVAGTAAYHTPDICPADEQERAAFAEVIHGHEVQQKRLHQLLVADGSHEMLGWTEALKPTCTDEVPASLKVPLPELEWSKLLIPNPHQPVDTKWQALPEKQELLHREAPQGWLSAVRAPYRSEAARRVRSFSKKMTKWLDKESEKPDPVVISGSWLEPWVFEAPHEFYSTPGWAVPIDVSEATTSHLNLDFFKEHGEGYPDQELISFICLGVRYKADLPVQVVLQPHLKSFLPVQDKYLAEADKFVERGWSTVHFTIPTVPYFSACCGSVCRPLEPDRPRCTNDAGAPRKELWAEDGIRVIPLNEAIADSEWPKEVKPSALDAMIALRVLQEAAQILGETVFIICDDYKSFFNQLRLSPSEFCKTGAVHPPRAGQDSVSFAFDRVLGFGIKMASNIAQRFADLLVHIFNAKMGPIVQKAVDQLCQRSSLVAEWWSDRLSLGAGQAILCAMLMYCDDPCIMCVGADMTHEALKAWTWMSAESHTMMAIHEKRSLGLSAKWIGIKFFTALGLAVVTAQKVLRAFSSIDAALDDSLNADQYRSLVGFLEHVRGTLFLRGDKMYGLYAPLNWQLEPIQAVKCTHLMKTQLQRFKHRLAVQSGSSVANLDAFMSGKPLQKVQHSVASRRWAAFSDAAKEGTDRPGLGAWVCGYVWRVPLSAEHLTLHISILEAIAAIVNVVCVHKLMGGTDHLPPDTCVEVHVDAQATAQILIRGAARSPAMAHLHSLAMELPAFVEMLPFILILHVFGLGNIASDAASRGYDQVLEIIANSLGLKLTHLPEPELAWSLLDACVEWRTKQRHEHCWGDDGIRFGDANHPGPTFCPIQRGVDATDCEPRFGVDAAQRAAGKRSFSDYQRESAVPSVSFAPLARQPDAEAAVLHPILQPSGLRVGQTTRAPSCRQRIDHISVNSLASALWADTSQFAICKGNFQQLVQACEVALSTAANAFSLRTSNQDKGHWKAWKKYCDTMGADPLRPPVDPLTDRVGYLRELVLLVNALTHFMKTHKPRSNSDRMIKPQSAMNILLGVNRVLRQNFLSFIPLKALKLPLKGLMRKFLLDFGPRSLVPKRREPFTNGMIHSLTSLPAGFLLGPLGPLDLLSIVAKSWRAAIAISTSAGFRKAEMFQSNEETFFLTWDLISWVVKGKPGTDANDSILRALRPGDFLVITPPPSKSDQFNAVWGAHPVYIPFRDTHRNAAAAIRDLALTLGEPFRAQSNKRAVFVNNLKRPLKGTTMSSALYSAMSSLVGNERAKLYTWHSGRIYLATALYASNVKPQVIQAMLRWQTDESLRAYARLSMDDSARMLDQAAKAAVASVQTSNIPIYEQFGLFLAIQQVVEE